MNSKFTYNLHHEILKQKKSLFFSFDEFVSPCRIIFQYTRIFPTFTYMKVKWLLRLSLGSSGSAYN